ncbi:tetratricopeptide repeat protein [Methylobacterium sp. ID0610]|uniref:tetratricopeptide repeat protein n=1 Tax=Methylobacterium carpenticola TaxID=3344827 RepID=UPI0036A7F149
MSEGVAMAATARITEERGTGDGLGLSVAVMDPAPLLARATALHRAGRAGADAIYRRVLALDPANADALHLHGVVVLQAGAAGRALGWIARATAVDGTQAIYRNSLGEALRALGRPEAALARYRQALALRPDYPEALANLLKQPAGPGGAARWLGRFCRLRPAAPALVAVATAHLLAGRGGEAERAARAAIILEPGGPEAYVKLGIAASLRKDQALAAGAYARALRLAPDQPEAWNNLASARWGLNDGAAALRGCRNAIALRPDHPDPYANLGHILRSHAQGAADFREAETLCRRALRLRPGHLSARNNLGIVHLDLGDLKRAETLFRGVLDAEPQHPDARFNLSLALLKGGRLREAWDLYEARWETGQLPRVRADLRPWRGEPLEGRTIALHAEQGQGDTLHFVRYAPLVAERGARVVLLVQPSLKRLVAGMPGVAAVYGTSEAFPRPDFHCPLLSLPRLFGTTLESVPARMPYLFPPAEAVARWLSVPLPGGGLRVGLVWSGDPRPGLISAHLTDRRRSMTLADFAPLARVPNLRLVNLQMGAPAAQLADPPPGLALHDPMGAVRDFADSAALILRLDLVITVDTSVAHLAGALGKPVWVLSRYDGCWRWLQDRDDSPWYPTMRLFRQTEPGGWAGVVARVAAALAEIAGQPPSHTISG